MPGERGDFSDSHGDELACNLVGMHSAMASLRAVTDSASMENPVDDAVQNLVEDLVVIPVGGLEDFLPGRVS